MWSEFRRENKVCLFEKSIYDLQKVVSNRHIKLDKTLNKFWATITKSDLCLFQTGSGKDATLIAVYVDDILIDSRKQKKTVKL